MCLMSPELVKRQNGQFYTEGNPFVLTPFTSWAKKVGLKGKKVLEPFAGANNIIRALQEQGYAKEFASFDIAPGHKDVKKRDTLTSFPQGYDVCITNPPWLAKNSARRRGLSFPATHYDDLYKYALDACLKHCTYVAALIPATYLRSGELRTRLDKVIFLQKQRMFIDTENPVCLALFVGKKTSDVEIYNDENYVDLLSKLEKRLPQPSPYLKVTFNHPEGELGLIAIDNTKGPSIRFVPGAYLADYEMKETSRMITRIQLDIKDLEKTIKKLNLDLEEFRKSTADVFLTPFKGLRKDGLYRRRIDYRLARDFIAKHVQSQSSLLS